MKKSLDLRRITGVYICVYECLVDFGWYGPYTSSSVSNSTCSFKLWAKLQSTSRQRAVWAVPNQSARWVPLLCNKSHSRRNYFYPKIRNRSFLVFFLLPSSPQDFFLSNAILFRCAILSLDGEWGTPRSQVSETKLFGVNIFFPFHLQGFMIRHKLLCSFFSWTNVLKIKPAQF